MTTTPQRHATPAQVSFESSPGPPALPGGTTRQPVLRSLTPAYVLTIIIVVLIAAASVTGVRLGPTGLYGDPTRAAGVTVYTAGLLVPGFLGHDLFNLVVGLPLLLGVLWLYHRGSLAGLLLWPGVLFYILYTYATYLLGAPFGPLFLAHVALVALSIYAAVILLVSIDGVSVRRQLERSVPARAIAGLLVALAVLTVAQDGSGAITSAFASSPPAEPAGRHIWAVDLAIEVPAVLIGGMLLWRRAALGYVVAAGLLLQFGLTPVALAAILGLQPLLIGTPVDVGTIVGVLVFAVACFVPLAFFLRSAWRRQLSEEASLA